MECILLGIGATMPLFKRPLTAAAVRLNGRVYFFDGGEGVQVSCKRIHLGFRPISVMAVTHLHADHCLGLPGILMMRARSEDPGPVTIIGPPGIERFVRNVKNDLSFYINYEIRFIEWNEDLPSGSVAYEDEQVKIRWAEMKHTTKCLGYALEEHERPGKFNVGKARALGVPEGILWSKLQRGESVELEEGLIVNPNQVLGPKRKGRKVAYITDTLTNKNLYALLTDSDLALIEGMFHSQDEESARRKMHLTAKEAGRLCLRSNVNKAVLIHVSPRYEDSKLSIVEDDAKTHFSKIEIGRFGANYSIQYPDTK